MAKKNTIKQKIENTIRLDSHPNYYESIIQNSHDAILGKTLDGTIVSWNLAAERLYGYKAHEIIGKSIFTIVPENKRREVEGIMDSISKGKQVDIHETIRVTKDGRHLHISVTVSPILDTDGTVIGASAIARDITHQTMIARHQEFMNHASTVLASSLNYNKTLQAVADLAVEYIGDWCAVDLLVSPGVVELLAVAHKDPEKVAWARQIRELYPVNMEEPQGVARVLLSGKPELYPVISDELLKASLKTKEQFEIVEKTGMKSVMIVPIFVRKKVVGAITFVSSSIENLFSKDTLMLAEDLARRAGQAIDSAILYKKANDEIEERKKVEAALRSSETKFRKLLTSHIIGVVVTKLNGRILEVNKYFQTLTGYSEEELTADKMTWKKLTPRAWHEDDKLAIAEVLEKGESPPREKEYLRKDGTAVPVLIGTTLLDKKDETCLTFVLDISEQKEIERRKDDFISVASHELKTPITSMKVFTQLLAKRFEKQEDMQSVSLVNRLDIQLNKLLVLVSDLLDVSRIHAGKLELRPEDFSLNDLVKETVEGLEQTTTHKIIIKDGQDQIRVHADRDRIGQVITNFLTNAIKYSPPHEDIIVHYSSDKDSVTVGVQDFGIGISKEEQERIFDRFYQANSSAGSTFPGLGMGLYISSEIIHRHGGNIRVESEKGKGSHFIFTIPLHHSLKKPQ